MEQVADDQRRDERARHRRPEQQAPVMRRFYSVLFTFVLEAAELRRVVTRQFDGLYQRGGRGRATHLRGAFGEIDSGLVHAGHAAQRRLHRRDAASATHAGDRPPHVLVDGGGGMGMVNHRYATLHLNRARSEATATPTNKTLDLTPRNTVASGQPRLYEGRPET